MRWPELVPKEAISPSKRHRKAVTGRGGWRGIIGGDDSRLAPLPGSRPQTKGVRMMSTIEVADQGSTLAYTFDDIMLYHGPGSPGGVAHAVKVMERVLPLLEPGGLPERREIEVETAFAGPGARDGFEMVTRAVTDGRYHVDDALARPERGPTHERFVFRLGYRGRRVTAVLREGYVGEEFIALARTQQRTAEQENRLTVLKREMAELLLATPAAEVYDVDDEA